MFKRTLLVFSVAMALAVVACTSSQTNSNNHNSTAANTAPASNTATSTTTPAATTAAPTGKIGIAECDGFIEKYAACVSTKVPASARAQYKTTLEQWSKSWRDLAANPQTRASLTQTCKTTIEQAKQSMKSYGCQF